MHLPLKKFLHFHRKAFSFGTVLLLRLFLPSACVGPRSRRGWLCSLSTKGPVVESARVSFRTLSNCFPLKAFTHLPLNGDFCPFMTLDQHSCLNSFIPGFKVVCPNRLINVLSCHCPKMARQCQFDSILGCTWPCLKLLRTSLVANRTWSHLVSKSWTSSSFKQMLNRSDRPWAAPQTPVA